MLDEVVSEELAEAVDVTGVDEVAEASDRGGVVRGDLLGGWGRQVHAGAIGFGRSSRPSDDARELRLRADAPWRRMAGMEIEATHATAATPTGHPTWRSLPRGAVGFRIAHVVWGVVELAALAHVWGSALRRRRDRALAASIVLLLAQGAALVAGRGNCPLGPFQRQLGDPVPMFELALPPRAAKAAIPVLFAVAVAGMVAVLVRPPSRPS